MKFQDFKGKLNKFIVFSISDIRKVDSTFYRHQLNEWQEKGYIKKLRRGYYAFSDTALEERVLFFVANRLYTPSYVSLEMALSHYGLIPEGVYSVTSVTSKKTSTFQTPFGTFVYHRMKPELQFGYALQEIKGMTYKIAEREKAFLDYIYLHPNIAKKEDFEEWRFAGDLFLKEVDMDTLMKYARGFANEAFVRRVESVMRMIKELN